ncbi:hypothetical protein CDAR_124331 [Caerostris darwini]|uniref:Uncharacterized protein n=1 Tax=Caerostris darwini TaxID=1538125 RepID=A0AAV4VSI1_9ARAC|nr:hypothetical protein CDAR_124331 [Caerostris darwini]
MVLNMHNYDGPLPQCSPKCGTRALDNTQSDTWRSSNGSLSPIGLYGNDGNLFAKEGMSPLWQFFAK